MIASAIDWRLWLLALSAWLLAAAPARGEEPPPNFFQEAEPAWLPHWTLPHPDAWEQLWRPGDLVDDSYWLRRPWSAGVFVGTMDGDDLTPSVREASDWFWGLRLGNDFAPRWGWELRSAFFSPNLVYADEPALSGTVQDWFVDLNLLHYPWGDTRFRPYWSIGAGGARYQFVDELDRDRRGWVATLPLAVGCKYYWKPWLALRTELGDTLAFGDDEVDFASRLHFSLGAEVHWHSFKTRPVKYGY